MSRITRACVLYAVGRDHGNIKAQQTAAKWLGVTSEVDRVGIYQIGSYGYNLPMYLKIAAHIDKHNDRPGHWGMM